MLKKQINRDIQRSGSSSSWLFSCLSWVEAVLLNRRQVKQEEKEEKVGSSCREEPTAKREEEGEEEEREGLRAVGRGKGESLGGERDEAAKPKGGLRELCNRD